MPAQDRKISGKKSHGTRRDNARDGLGGASHVSEGHRLLVGMKASVRVVARAAGAGKSSVQRWMSGEGVPEPDARRNLRSAYGIPIEAWDQPPQRVHHDDAEPAEAEPDAPEVEPPTGAAEHFLELIRGFRRIRPTLSPSEQLKALKEEGGLRKAYDDAVGKVAKDWDYFIRTEQWERFENLLMHTLDKYPEAKAAVHEAFEKLGR